MLWKLPVDPWVRVNFDAGFFVHLQATNVGVVDLGFQTVELKGDSAVLISKFNVVAIDRSTMSSIIWDVKRLVLGFEHFMFHHIKRGGNTVAHLLAREGFLRRRDVCGMEEGGGTNIDSGGSG
ncbi:hypothetical protein Golob_021834 [Gossypium lobatum]|uniref:RNase H type-1 domain-containing protein n=1 Tax=Gossypium lobatum TaxID=34289 RepID=A0A7J8LEQ2_9ROSI|nr:hypothetical protein [Gossypium lobatum]